MLPAGTRLAVLAGISAALLPLAAVAAIMDWEKLADEPTAISTSRSRSSAIAPRAA
jgi:hypothetical protein